MSIEALKKVTMAYVNNSENNTSNSVVFLKTKALFKADVKKNRKSPLPPSSDRSKGFFVTCLECNISRFFLLSRKNLKNCFMCIGVYNKTC